jgi:hypothetical protein
MPDKEDSSAWELLRDLVAGKSGDWDALRLYAAAMRDYAMLSA